MHILTASTPERWRSDVPYIGIIDGKIAIMQREKGTLTPNGNPMDQQWVLRIDGVMVDFDRYSHDIASRNGIDLQQHPSFRL